ncbi:hypothetical protein [Streptomyces sp. YIM 132580]|uniref:hypothetical protein n=1 Tax=Streptomyces sp. YIM 132580 TaxID=2691958 RepID=UPI0013692969|nr:hypothetical protein [Streptomyces sp. YIM 132580]
MFSVPDGPGALNGEYVYKRYRSGVAVDAAALETAVEFPSRLPLAERSDLDGRLAWPEALVTDDGRVTGFLMRRVPKNFFLDPDEPEPRPAGVEFLLSGTERLQVLVANSPPARQVVDADCADRLRLLIDLGRTLDILHRHGAVVGDLSPRNILYALAPEPNCLLIDCDSMRLDDRSAVQPVETVDWQVPDGEHTATEESDAYKYGLLAVRLFARDQTSTDVGPLREVSPELASLAQRALEGKPQCRPRVGEWSGPLRQALASAVAPPPAAVPAGRAARRRRRPDVVTLLFAVLALVSYWQDGTGGSGTVSAGPPSPSVTAPASLPPHPDAPSSTGGESADAVPDARPASTPPTAAPPLEVAMGDDLPNTRDNRAIAAMLGNYYRGINNYYEGGVADPDLAVQQVDTAGPILKGGSEKWRQNFVDGGTRISDARLLAVTRNGKRTLANVQFRSEQEDGYGPSPDKHQTCTRWDLLYQLSADAGGYRIYSARGPHEPC